MDMKVINAGLDVDDNQYHESVLNKNNREFRRHYRGQ